MFYYNFIIGKQKCNEFDIWVLSTKLELAGHRHNIRNKTKYKQVIVPF